MRSHAIKSLFSITFSATFLLSKIMYLKGEVTTAIEIQTPAAKFFNFLLNQLHEIQNITERVHEIKDVQLQGFGHAIGSVRSWTFTLDGKVAVCKDRIEAIDEQKKAMTYKLFDGEVSQSFKMLRIFLQVTDREGGDVGAVVKWTYAYQKLNDKVPPPYAYLDFITKVTEDVDAHLLMP
ncbi:unnamed protein product [Sphenostylis stenocarpa]|uniref:Bet v I/Major latex protein domain-containing protein n=1 Tax=Sphenostylis stenocarpa TaxID=92480 RepID=A0AA86SDI6_9FABA|nr:unnamed protein product [Sphenostylis stenocarpa]